MDQSQGLKLFKGVKYWYGSKLIWTDFEKNILMTYSLNRRFGEYGESSEKSLSLKSDVYVLAVGVESYRLDFIFNTG